MITHVLDDIVCSKRYKSRIYESQKIKPNGGDWVKLVEKDKVVLNIDLTDEEIEEMSKAKFKKIVDSNIENYTLQ